MTLPLEQPDAPGRQGTAAPEGQRPMTPNPDAHDRVRPLVREAKIDRQPQPRVTVVSDMAPDKPARRSPSVRRPESRPANVRRTLLQPARPRLVVRDDTELLTTTVAYDAAVGRAAHALISALLPEAQGLSAMEIAPMTGEVVVELVRAEPALHPRTRSARVEVRGLATLYLTRLCPPSFVEFLGAETSVTGGRLDLLFRHATLGVFVDEIKARRDGTAPEEDRALDQATRYVSAETTAGEVTAVRLLNLRQPNGGTLFLPGGRSVALPGTALSPAALGRDQDRLVAAGGDVSVLSATLVGRVVA